MILKQDLLKPTRTTCIKCGTLLYISLIASTEEYILKKLFQRKEEELNGNQNQKEGKEKQEAEEKHGSNRNWKRFWKKER